MRRTAAAVLGSGTCLAIGEDGRVEAGHAVLHHGQADHCRPHSALEDQAGRHLHGPEGAPSAGHARSHGRHGAAQAPALVARRARPHSAAL
jgi:hypothetical protein